MVHFWREERFARACKGNDLFRERLDCFCSCIAGFFPLDIYLISCKINQSLKSSFYQDLSNRNDFLFKKIYFVRDFL